MSIRVKVTDFILKPEHEVFDAILNPDKINKYFVSKSSGTLTQGSKIIWEFTDHCVNFEIEVISVELNKHISFQWRASGKEAIVDIFLEMENETRTKIIITEGSFELNDEEVQKAMQQTQGWTDFICSLKAYLYTGINLRKGK